MKKKILATLLSVTLAAGVLAGCGQTETTTQTGSSSASQAESTTDTAKEETEQSQEEVSLSQDLETIHVYIMKMGDANIDAEAEIEAAINEYIEPLIYADIDLNFIEQASWTDQINMMIAADEDIDLICGVRQLKTLYQNGGLMELDDLLDQYGSGIKEAVAQKYLDACVLDGKLYAIPTIRDLASNEIYMYDADIAAQYGLEMKDAMTLEELETELLKLHEAAPDLVPIYMNSMVRTLSSWPAWDPMDDNFGVVFYDGDGSVENLYESDYYTNLVQTTRRWFQEGLIYSEAAVTTSTFLDLINAGTGFGAFAGGQPGYDTNMSNTVNRNIKMTEVMPAVATTSGVQTISWLMPVTCQVPEKSMALLNLLYSDAYVVNTLTYGIEGEHYQFVDEAEGIIGYPDGVTYENSSWNSFPTYMAGNETIGYIWEGFTADRWTVLSAFNESATPSPALGFAFDNSSVTNEITACNNVIAKYAVSIETGSVDLDENLPKFQQELRDAGIDKIIEEKQRQFDEWKAVNR